MQLHLLDWKDNFKEEDLVKLNDARLVNSLGFSWLNLQPSTETPGEGHGWTYSLSELQAEAAYSHRGQKELDKLILEFGRWGMKNIQGTFEED